MENFWIDKERDREKYFEVRKEQGKIEKFFWERAGWKSIFGENVIRVEKIPDKAESFMGIDTFQDKIDYCILCALLLFLEDKENGEQFLLKEMLDSTGEYLKEVMEADWTKFTHRKALVRAFDYAERMGMIKKTEGDIRKYSNDDYEEVEVLYEKTELSRYFLLNSNKDIFNVSSYKDFETYDNGDIDVNRGEYRSNRVYRKLLTTPALYWDKPIDPDSIYLRNQKPIIKTGIEELVEGELHINRNVAFVVLENKKKLGEVHPDGTMLSEIVLLICGEIRKNVIERKFKPEINDEIYLSQEEFAELIKDCQEKYSINWSKEYREMKKEKIAENIKKYMESWMLLRKEEEKIVILPAVGRIIGRYSRRRKNGNE